MLHYYYWHLSIDESNLRFKAWRNLGSWSFLVADRIYVNVAKPWRVFLLLSFVPNNLKQTKKTFWQWR
jgi:hypothetical protein